MTLFLQADAAAQFNVGRFRLQANVDLYNALNASPILGRNNTYGSAWGTPVTSLATGAGVLDGRLLQFSARVTF